MASHVEQAVAARVAAARARIAQQRAEREAFAANRRRGLTARHSAKLRHLAAVEQQPADTAATDQGAADE